MTKETTKPRGINTRLAHSGHDPRAFHGFVQPPVVHASTVLFPDAGTMASRNQRYTYGTRGTPTSDALAEAVDALGLEPGVPAVASIKSTNVVIERAT